MEFDFVKLTFNAIVIFIYGSICLLSIIFTFFIETYRKIDEKLKWEIFSIRIINPLEQNINVIDELFMRNNKILGAILILLSLVDLQLWLRLISQYTSIFVFVQ